MRTYFRTALAIVPALVALSAAPAPAHAATPPDTMTYGITVVTCPWNKDCRSEPLHSDDPSAIYASFSTGGSPSSYGTRWVEVWVTDRSAVFNTVVYRYHVRLTWSWGYGTVVNPAGASWVTDMDSTHQWTANTGSAYFYNYAWGLENSGFRFYRQGQIDNCFFGVCGFTSHPYGWIRGHGDGTYSYDWGYS
jgi:hypothetical protein